MYFIMRLRRFLHLLQHLLVVFIFFFIVLLTNWWKLGINYFNILLQEAMSTRHVFLENIIIFFRVFGIFILAITWDWPSFMFRIILTFVLLLKWFMTWDVWSRAIFIILILFVFILIIIREVCFIHKHCVLRIYEFFWHVFFHYFIFIFLQRFILISLFWKIEIVVVFSDNLYFWFFLIELKSSTIPTCVIFLHRSFISLCTSSLIDNWVSSSQVIGPTTLVFI